MTLGEEIIATLITLFKEHISFRFFLALLFSTLWLLPSFVISRNRKKYFKAFLLPLRRIGNVLADIEFMEDFWFYITMVFAYWFFIGFALLFGIPLSYVLFILVIIGGWAILGGIEAHKILKDVNPDRDRELFNFFLIFLSIWISQVVALLSYWLVKDTNSDHEFWTSFSFVFTSIYMLAEPVLIVYAIMYSIEAIKYKEDSKILVSRIVGVWKRIKKKNFRANR